MNISHSAAANIREILLTFSSGSGVGDDWENTQYYMDGNVDADFVLHDSRWRGVLSHGCHDLELCCRTWVMLAKDVVVQHG